MRTPVLIVGGGLAGLTTAVMLAWRGVRPLLVERHADTSKNPRARGVNFRTMELLRVAGLEPDLAAAGSDLKEFAIVVAESVTGRELRTILPRGSFDTSALSPAAMSHVGQDRAEPILRQHAEALGADVRYFTELVEFEQDAGGVTATIRDRRSGMRRATGDVFSEHVGTDACPLISMFSPWWRKPGHDSVPYDFNVLRNEREISRVDKRTRA